MTVTEEIETPHEETPSRMWALHAGAWAAYAALATTLLAIPAILSSEVMCVDQTEVLTQPGETLAALAIMVAPLAAVASLVLLRLARGTGRRRGPAIIAAILTFPLVVVDIGCYINQTLLVCWEPVF